MQSFRPLSKLIDIFNTIKFLNFVAFKIFIFNIQTSNNKHNIYQPPNINQHTQRDRIDPEWPQEIARRASNGSM